MNEKIERITIIPQPDGLRNHEQVGDLQVTALVQTSPKTVVAHPAIIRDDVLAVFLSEMVGKDDLKWRPVIGTVRGPSSVMHGVRLLSEIMGGIEVVTFDPAPDYLQAIAKSVPILPPKLPHSVKARPYLRLHRKSDLDPVEVEVEVEIDLEPAMGLRTSKDKLHRWVHIDITDDEFREMLVWHFRQMMKDWIYWVDGKPQIKKEDIDSIADGAFRRIFGEIRDGVVMTGRDVGVAP